MANSELSIRPDRGCISGDKYRLAGVRSRENTEAILKKKALRPDILILEPRKLNPDKVKEANEFFARHKGKAFLPAHQIATDAIRAELDEFVLRELLGAADISATIKILRSKLGEEPSFNGGRR
jgi:hypothetical protein